LLIGVHSLCLAVGFWFLYQLVCSSTEHQALEVAWTQLTARSAPLAEFASKLNSSTFPADSFPSDRHVQAVLVDRNWTVLKSVQPAESNAWSTGQRAVWQVEHQFGPGHARGRLQTSTGPRAALTLPTSDSNTLLVVYDAAPLDPTWRTSLLAALPLAIAIAFLWTWVLSSVATFLFSARLTSEEMNRKTQSEHDALRSAQDLLRTRDAVIFGLAKLAESRDPETGHHLERISLYSTRLANALRLLPQYHREVTPGFIRLLGISSVLHDIGKVGLEDTVLLKPGRLNTEERKKMQEHTLVAGACLKEIEQRLGASNFLQTAREIALHHHERWDGNGYPAGLAGEAIPLAARIVTVADVYDALSSKRVYKEAFPHDECVRLIREGAGTQFDPQLVEVFLSIEADFAAIGRKFAAGSHEAEAPVVDSVVMSPAQESLLRDVVTGTKSSPDLAARSSSVA
jgi:HD-GYP domain-containing protein (c-di-GMP phosphodiesterase class II)